MFKLNNLRNSTSKVNQISLKEKYSFFNHFFYRKNVLRKLLRIRSYSIKIKIEDTISKTSKTNLLYFYKSVSVLDTQKSSGNDISDFSIQRIRFKPGYQVIWRKARLNLQELLGLKVIYQKKLTRILSRFYRLSHFNTCNSNILIAEKAILASRLLPDPSTISTFIKNGYIFLNGIGLKDQKSLLFYGDFLQLRLSIWAINYSNFLSKWYKLKFNKLKTFAKKKLPGRVRETNKLFRTRTTKISAKFLNFTNLEATIPNLMEVDFFTASAIILSKPKANKHIDSKNQILLRVNIFKNYNWKYLN